MNRNIYSIPPKIKKILVVAGNYQEFKNFCDGCTDDELNDPGKWEGTDFIYCSSFDTIRGMRFDDHYLVGTYNQRKDFRYDIIQSVMK